MKLHNTLSKKRYFLSKINEINGEYEYDSLSLMVCENDEDEEAKQKDIALNFRSGGEMDDDGNIWFNGETAIKKLILTEISFSEFETLKKFIMVL